MLPILAASGHDLGVLFTVLAILAFAVAIYLAYVGNFVAAVAAALIAVIILVVT